MSLKRSSLFYPLVGDRERKLKPGHRQRRGRGRGDERDAGRVRVSVPARTQARPVPDRPGMAF